MAGVRGVPREHPRQGPGLASPGRRALRRMATANSPSGAWITSGDILPGVVGTSKPLNANPTAVSTTDTNEDTLMSFTLPAGTLANVGDSIMVEGFITTTNSGTTKQIRFYFGVVQWNITFSGGVAHNLYYMIRIMRLDATHQQITGQIGGASSDAQAIYVAGTQTLSASQVVKFTGQAADIGGGTITQQMMNIQLSQP